MSRRTIAFLALIAAASACRELPHDVEGTSARIERTRTIRVGVAVAPPWVLLGEVPAGLEADLVRAVARAEGARVEWVWGNLEDHYRRLEEFELDLVAGGITDDTPWKKKVALTRPWVEVGGDKHVVAVPPGENAWLVRIEQHLRSHGGELAKRLPGAKLP